MAKLLKFPLIRAFKTEKLHKSDTIYVILAFVRIQIRRKACIRAMLQPVLLGITCACALVLRRSNIEAITQRELDATGIIVLHFTKHHPIAVKHDMIDTAIENIVTSQFNIQTVLEEVFADTEREHGIGAVNPNV